MQSNESESIKERIQEVIDVGDIRWWEIHLPEGDLDFHPDLVESLGYDSTEFTHYEDLLETVHPEDREKVLTNMEKHIAGEVDNFDIKYRVETKDGECRWLHNIGGVTRWNGDDSPCIISGMAADITEKEAVKAELDQKNKQLMLLNDIVRHDIKNDVAIASGYLELMENAVPEDVKDEYEKVSSSVDHIQMTAANVKDVIAVIGNGDMQLQNQSISLPDVLYCEVNALREVYGEDTVEITVEDIPDVQINSNGLISSVFKNLIENAIEHGPAEDPMVEIRAEESDGIVKLSVTDNGPGIPDEIKERINSEGENTLDDLGLGLFIVKNLVDDFGGKVTVEDVNPTGSKFTITLNKA